jgi:CBS domain-containing protein
MTATLPPQLPLPLSSSPPSKYRFSAVDDLQLSPALSVRTTLPLSEALTLALDRDYSQLTVISPERRKLLGYLDISAVLERLQRGEVAREATVADVYTKFDRRRGYQVITPDTSLDELEEFLKEHDFAVGMC